MPPATCLSLVIDTYTPNLSFIPIIKNFKNFNNTLIKIMKWSELKKIWDQIAFRWGNLGKNLSKDHGICKMVEYKWRRYRFFSRCCRRGGAVIGLSPSAGTRRDKDHQLELEEKEREKRVKFEFWKGNGLCPMANCHWIH